MALLELVVQTWVESACFVLNPLKKEVRVLQTSWNGYAGLARLLGQVSKYRSSCSAPLGFPLLLQKTCRRRSARHCVLSANASCLESEALSCFLPAAYTRFASPVNKCEVRNRERCAATREKEYPLSMAVGANKKPKQGVSQEFRLVGIR